MCGRGGGTGRIESTAGCPIIGSYQGKNPMITSKRMMLDVMSKCENADILTRIEKFQVFCNVCDNMLKEGRMTKATHKRFTEIW